MMNNRTISLVLIVAVASLAVGFVALGCSTSGGGVLTIEEYFQRLQEIDDASSLRSDAIEAQFDEDSEAADGENEILALFIESFVDEFDNFDQLGSDLADLDPPGEVTDGHNEAVTAIRGAVSAFRDVEGDFAAAGSIDEVIGLFLSDDFDNAQQQAIDSCLALEQLSVELDNTVDLDCDE